MSTTLIVILIVVLVLVGLITYTWYRMKHEKPVADSSRIRHLGNKNFKPAIRRGLTLVDFWAPWCGPCKVAAPILNELAETTDRFVIAKVNVDKQPQLAQRYKIRNIPTLVLFQDGKEVGRYVGVKTKKFLMSEIEARLN